MCGICGFSGAPRPEVLARMTSRLVHRGPDDEGRWSDGRMNLGMRRLAIIDPRTGRQPVANEDESIRVVFNGEIYNFPELRADLEARGHRFRTDHSDTEVIVHLYEEYGPDCLHHLNGMFAIALWDARRRELWLARDRAGVKPLYLAHVGGELVFGSEIKAILEHPDVGRAPDFAALHHYFTFKNVPAPLSAFSGIGQLRPGERALFRDGQLTRERWWRPVFGAQHAIAEAEAAARVRELLADSVRLRMRSDVPFGAFLSGGVDSSAVVALMAQVASEPVRTFTLVYADDFPNKAQDQRFARDMATALGTEHHEHVVTSTEVQDTLGEVVTAFDEPFCGVTSTWFLARLISRHVKVALSGDGADELFGSYLAHRLAWPLHEFDAMGGDLATLDGQARARLAPFEDEPGLVARIAGAGDELARRMALYLWDDPGREQLYSPAMRAYSAGVASSDLVARALAGTASDDPLNRALCVDFETLLPDQVLAFVDRLSMAHSVEVRTPFLDYRLVEYATGLPGALKIRGGRVKHVLKEALRGVLPRALLDRPKEGFVMPVNAWLARALRPLAEQTLAPARLASHGLWDAAFVQGMLADFYGGRRELAGRVWSLVMFQHWWERYFG